MLFVRLACVQSGSCRVFCVSLFCWIWGCWPDCKWLAVARIERSTVFDVPSVSPLRVHHSPSRDVPFFLLRSSFRFSSCRLRRNASLGLLVRLGLGVCVRVGAHHAYAHWLLHALVGQTHAVWRALVTKYLPCKGSCGRHNNNNNRRRRRRNENMLSTNAQAEWVTSGVPQLRQWCCIVVERKSNTGGGGEKSSNETSENRTIHMYAYFPLLVQTLNW